MCKHRMSHFGHFYGVLKLFYKRYTYFVTIVKFKIIVISLEIEFLRPKGKFLLHFSFL